jgi:carnitine O-acetyltransferase
MVESHGDYRDEKFLEEHIGGPLYENQMKLPRLPIPSIEETLERFLPTALPLAKTKEEEMALKVACEAFPEQAKVLQERLIERQENEMKDSSWLQLWWNQVSYKVEETWKHIILAPIG